MRVCVITGGGGGGGGASSMVSNPQAYFWENDHESPFN